MSHVKEIKKGVLSGTCRASSGVHTSLPVHSPVMHMHYSIPYLDLIFCISVHESCHHWSTYILSTHTYISVIAVATHSIRWRAIFDYLNHQESSPLHVHKLQFDRTHTFRVSSTHYDHCHSTFLVVCCPQQNHDERQMDKEISQW